MGRFLLRRLGWFAVTVAVVVTVSFALMRAVPGGPFDADRALHPVVERNLQARYHLDWPLWRQFLQYVGPFNLDRRGLLGDRTDVLGGVLTGDLGPSFAYRDQDVAQILAQSLPVSIQLGTMALAWALLLGLPAGLLAALWRGRWPDLALRVAATVGVALPNFVVAGFLVLWLAFPYPVFPVAGWDGGLRHAWLPSFALGLPVAAWVARLSRAGLLDVLGQDWVVAARARGLSAGRVLARHALRAGLLPVVSYLGPAAAGILTGSLVIERIFFVPGTGSHFVDSALNRDYTLAMGVTLVYTVLVYALNTAADVAYAFLDPRIELDAPARSRT